MLGAWKPQPKIVLTRVQDSSGFPFFFAESEFRFKATIIGLIGLAAINLPRCRQMRKRRLHFTCNDDNG